MRILKLLIWIVILVVGILFALFNTQTIQLRFFILYSKLLPVWLFLIIAFVIGLVVSFAYSLIDILGLKKQIKEEKTEIAELKKEIGYLRNLTITRDEKVKEKQSELVISDKE